MKSILVTGANGFVGKHLVNSLLNDGEHVITVSGTRNNSVTQNSDSRKLKNLTIDLTNKEAIKEIDFKEIDRIIHLAGLASVGPSFDNPMLYINNNIAMQCNLYETAIEQQISPRFLIISSGSLYNPNESLPLTENSSVVPNSPYAVSKIGQEELAKYYSRRGIEYLIARPFNHAGPGQDLGFIVADLAQQIVAVEKGETDKIFVGNLDAQRDYTDVRDIVKAYKILINSSSSEQTYNICSGVPVSGKELLNELLKLASINVEVVIDPKRMRPSDTPTIYGSYEKINQETGWKPTISLQTTLRDTLNFWRNKQ